MTTMTTQETKRPGRPRSAKAHKAILQAATALLLEQGLQSMNMDELAERAGVSKATIYRWWASKELLALDALVAEWQTSGSIAERDTGSLRGDLLAQIRPWIRKLNDKPYGRVIAGFVAQAQTDPEFATLYREHFVQPRRDATRPIFLRALDRGEVAQGADLDVTLDLLYGPIYHRMLHGHAPLNDRFVQAVVDAVIKAVSPREPAASPRRPPRN
jgi:AcrR family transcriptional regulator